MLKEIGLWVTTAMLCACASEPVWITPQLYIPEFAISKVVPQHRKIDLTRESVDGLKKVSTDKKQEKFVNDLVYNYVNDYYGLDICNAKLDALHEYIDYYQERTVGF